MHPYDATNTKKKHKETHSYYFQGNVITLATLFLFPVRWLATLALQRDVTWSIC